MSPADRYYPVGWEKYYFQPEDGSAAKGLITVNGYTYYFDETGQAQTGLQTIHQELYYFNSNGIMQTGFQKIGDTRYFFHQETGQAETGLISANGAKVSV